MMHSEIYKSGHSEITRVDVCTKDTWSAQGHKKLSHAESLHSIFQLYIFESLKEYKFNPDGQKRLPDIKCPELNSAVSCTAICNQIGNIEIV